MLKTKTVAQLMATPKPLMLIEGMLIQRGLHMFQSHSGTGKTFLGLELAIAVATGMPALEKFQVANHGKVLYLGEDSPEWDVREQFRKLCTGKGIGTEHFDLPWEFGEDGEIDPASGPQMLFCINEGNSLNSEDAVDKIVEEVVSGQYALVILDTLGALNEGNENDNGWMGLVMKRIKRIREHAAVLLIHHTKKPGEFEQPGTTGARGASAIGASVDGALSLKTSKGHVQVRIAKQRAIRLTEFDYIIEWDDDQARLVVVEANDPITDALRKALIKTGPKGMSRAEMLEVVKKSCSNTLSPSIQQSLWWKSIQALMADGTAYKVKRGVYAAKGLVKS